MQTSDGGYILLGSASSLVQDLPDILLLKIDAAGNPQWNRTITTLKYVDSFPGSIQQTSDGGYLVSGQTHQSAGNNSGIITIGNSLAFLLKLHSNGSTQWNETFSGADSSSGMQARQTSDGGYIASISAPWYLGYDVWLWRTNANGTTLWSKPVLDNSLNVFYLQQTADGNYVLAGYGTSAGDVLMKVSGTPPPFSLGAIPAIYATSGIFLVAGIAVAIVAYLRTRKTHKPTR